MTWMSLFFCEPFGVKPAFAKSTYAFGAGSVCGDRQRDAVAGVRDTGDETPSFDVRQLRDRASRQRVAIELRLLLWTLRTKTKLRPSGIHA